MMLLNESGHPRNKVGQVSQRGRCTLPKKGLNSIGQTGRLVNLLLAFLGFLLFAFSASAQTTVSSSEFLSKAFQNQSLLLHERQLDFLKNTDHQLPWAKGLEFRTETDELDLGRQEYIARFRYHTKAERQAQWDLHQSDIQMEEVEKTLILEEALMDHYFFLVKYLFLSRKINTVKEELLVASDKINVLRKKAAARADVDLNDLLVAEEKNHNLELELLGLEGEFDQLKKIISAAFNANGNIDLDTAGIFTIIELKDKLALLPLSPAANPGLPKRQLDIDKNLLEYEKERAENGWKLDYVQFKHAARDKLSYTKEWSFGMGMEIPLKEGSKLAKNELMLERISLENRLALQVADLAERLQSTYQEIELKIRQHDLVARQLVESQLKYSSETYPAYSDADPIILLNIKSNLLKRQSDRLGIEKDIYMLYLELIELSGKAVELPLRNYLTSDWALLEK